MNTLEVVKDTLAAIRSVKSRARAAMERGDNLEYAKLMGDLITLEVCLVGSTEKLVADVEKDAA